MKRVQTVAECFRFGSEINFCQQARRVVPLRCIVQYVFPQSTRLIQFVELNEVRQKLRAVVNKLLILAYWLLLKKYRRRLTAGFEKIVLKNGRFVGYFISKQDSAYFNGEVFTGILKYVQKYPQRCKMKETNKKLMLTFENIKNINSAIDILNQLLDKKTGAEVIRSN